MNGEFRNLEKNELKTSVSEGFRDIKPEKAMTMEEANKQWDGEYEKAKTDAGADNPASSAENINNMDVPDKFQTLDEVRDKEIDDHGQKMRDGEHLKANSHYEVNGYKYETDSLGRITSAEGKLRISDTPRHMEDVRSMDGQDYQEGDHRGHLIGHQFGGSDKLDNLVPMASELNQGDYKKMENTLAEAVSEGADVRFKVEPVYEGESNRPTEFKCIYSIDGDKEVVVFKNENGAHND